MELLTSASLLIQLRDPDDARAWERFYNVYAPLILAFAHRNGCSDDDARDVLQETMVCILRSLPSFRYDPAKGKFRSYLLRIVDSRIKDAWRRRQREAALDRALVAAGPDRNPGPAPATAPTEWKRLWQHNLLLQALSRIRRRTDPRTYRSFELYVLQGQPVAAVQAELSCSANTVYQHRHRMLRRLRREVDKLKMETGD